MLATYIYWKELFMIKKHCTIATSEPPLQTIASNNIFHQFHAKLQFFSISIDKFM